MEQIRNRCPGCRRAVCDGCGIYREAMLSQEPGSKETFKRLHTNKYKQPGFPKAFKAEMQEGLGISFDAGTTTLAGMLWDLEEGRLLDAETASNPQAIFGADVISRIRAAEEEKNRKKLQKLLVGQLDEMADKMMNRMEKRGEGSGIRRVTVAGNTAICELLLGIKPEGLFAAPFTPDYNSTVCVEGKKLGFTFLANAQFLILPPIGGYVGADALAVYGYVAMQEQGKTILAVDIGTNGEILLMCGEKKYACSAAAGPALEGGTVRQGMRAAEGAIDKCLSGGRFPVEDLVCRVAGGGEPKGICGSGLVDVLALLWKRGILDPSGYMRSPLEARAAGAPERLCRRIREEKGRRFLLTDEKTPVFLTADDVRQLQLSVSALRSGMEILLRKAKLKASELDRIYLAGAFGCYIGVESAVTAGLLPPVEREKIVQAGNLAGVGAAMALLSPEALAYMEAESAGFEHVELAQEEDFKTLFLTHMNYDEKR